MKKLSIYETAKAVGANINFDGVISDISTDTRTMKEGNLFVALEGENFDGHTFIRQAIDMGAAAVLSHKDLYIPRVIRVQDTRKALLRLATYYRSLFNIPVVGITGSVGKTTVKELTHAILSQKYQTHKNEGNLNNEIGMSQSIFKLEEHHQAAVFEMGMSDLGEISELSKAAKPTLGIINNVGISHIQNLGSRENILKAKLEILNGMGNDSPLILNGDNYYLYNAKIRENPTFYFGIDNKFCRFKAYDIEENESGSRFILDYGCGEQKIFMPAIGKHNIYNVLSAFAAGYLLGVEPDAAAEAIAQYEPSGMRQRVRKEKNIVFIEDCYNANPDSLRAAISTLVQFKAKRRIAVIGDMLELGELSNQAHADAGLYAANAGVDVLFTYGEKAKIAAKTAKSGGVKTLHSFDDKEELAKELASLLCEGDAVVFKASRSMKLEEVIKSVYKELGIGE
ncbi:MAG TPA: UDP-N-acetylmuramoyl-tripeptide--D-alanyl-D-alanine ligase [Clostridia bacterium]|nr:UDP-N-acetylmuramoyl-tripeptide--D-alanyl-D-alanine ligase [Clostridia bacterium]